MKENDEKVIRYLYINVSIVATLVMTMFFSPIECCESFFVPLTYYLAFSSIVFGFAMIGSKIYYHSFISFIFNKPTRGVVAVFQGFIAIAIGIFLLWILSHVAGV